MTKLREKIDNILFIIQDNSTGLMAGNLAFSLVLTMISLLALLAIVLTSFNLDFIKASDLIPEPVKDVLLSSVNSSIGNVNLIVYVLAGLLVLRGAKALIIISNKIYEVPKEERGFKYFFKSLQISLVVVLIIVTVAFLAVASTRFIDIVYSKGVSVQKAHLVNTVLRLVSVLLSTSLLYLLISYIFRKAPSIKLTHKDVRAGAIFTTISWLIFTKFYSYYIGLTYGESSFYGSMSNVITTMWWAYILSIFMVIGIKINKTKD